MNTIEGSTALIIFFQLGSFKNIIFSIEIKPPYNFHLLH